MIPTGADYHIIKARSYLSDVPRLATTSTSAALMRSLEEIIKALELIQQEREKEKEAK